MELKEIKELFSVCKIKNPKDIPWEEEFVFVGKTDEEFSLVCPVSKVPDDVEVRDDGWKAFRIQGTLDFSLIGILSKISGILAEAKIGIFAVSTYNTDYILTKKENFQNALEVLEKAGYTIC